MTVAIVTTGRFHVLDLARELCHLGHEVAFYSCVPSARCQDFGLARRSHRTLLPILWPLTVLEHYGPPRWRPVTEEWKNRALDHLVANRLNAADVFIGMSGICVASARAAKRLGATIFLERGSRHILSQVDILTAASAPTESLPSRHTIERELWGYEFADVISVPSRHAAQSFLERGMPPAKLFRNPYGVDLTAFAPTQRVPSRRQTVLFVGAWSLRKGCDLLWEACRASNKWDLLHVGPTGDLPLPQSARFLSAGAVSQERLIQFYARADVCVLPSREDGFGVVLSQALACGLPIVCSDMTGGPDLKELIGESDFVEVFRSGDVAELGAAIDRALRCASAQSGELRDLLGAAREKLSWRAYGERYAVEIERRLSVPN